MKRFITFLFSCLLATLLYANSSATQINLNYSPNSPYIDPEVIDETDPRVPALHKSVYLINNIVLFNAFNENCTIELIEIDSDEVIFRQLLTGNDISCTLPANLNGEYVLRFVFYNYMYWCQITF